MTPQDKETLDRIYDKHYGPNSKRMGSKAKKENAKLAKVIEEKKQIKVTAPKTSSQAIPGDTIATKVKIVDQPISTRKDLMQEAQKHGIKYFRILTKDELTEVLSQTDKNYINGIIENARKRWQSGWTKNK